MRLDISELLKKKCTEVNFCEAYELKQLSRDDFAVTLVSPLTISGRAEGRGDIVEIKGEFYADLEVECSSCLDRFEYALKVDFDECFSRSVKEALDRSGVISEEEEYYPIIDGDVVFDDMVMDQIILNLPVKLLCNEECKGLCHVCGVNLNKVDCDCEKETVNPKFAALKDLFKQDEEV